MRLLSLSALYAGLVTLSAAVALRASEAVLAVAAVAALVVVLTYFARLHGDDERSSLGLVNPASALTLAVVGRRPWSTLLPTIAAHAVGAVLGGLIALALEDSLGQTLALDTPSFATVIVGAALIGVLGAWTTIAIDADASDGFAAVPVIVGGGLLPVAWAATFHPAAMLGLATAGIVPWDLALTGAAVTFIASFVGAHAVSLLVPPE